MTEQNLNAYQFEVGDMVVCVDAKYRNQIWADRTPNRPALNGVYTVREVTSSISGLPAIYLQEIVNPFFHFLEGYAEPGFPSSRFRKIRKPSIEIFRDIVASVKGDRNVDA